MHVATVERKNSLLTGRNLQQNQAQYERPSATTDWGFERTEQRHKENKEALIQDSFLWEGKVELNERRGDPIPDSWGCDPQAHLTTDPKSVLTGGGLVPIGGSEATGGYKGYGLGMMVEVFCGILAGAQYSKYVRTRKVTDRVANLGQCFVAINPENFAPGFNERMSDLLSIQRDQDPADPGSPVLAPGDPERMNTKKCEEMGGIPYHVIKYINDYAKKIGVSQLLPCDKIISI
ncbi:hypothetical protein ILYODFUR_032768 [Ilyodon furcidens]|uniref:Malate dehydrogenase n=1 Tax=Ilyodon furcidens TaxID=33524 RepID=A0ABV0T2L7_9TELE